MIAVTRRIHALCWVTLLVTSCDKSNPRKEELPVLPSKERITKSDRTADEKPVVTRSSLQRSLDEATGVTTPKDRDQALAAVIEEALELDPELALEAFNQMAVESPDRDRMVEHFAMRFAERDLDGAVHWARSLETDEERSRAFGNIALVLSEENPEGAAQVLSDSGVSSHDFDVAVVQVIQRWAEQSPENAAAWVVQFDPGEARSAGLKAIASAWLDQDPKAANAWIAGLQEPAIRDEAVNGMAETILEFPDSFQIENLRFASPEVRLRLEKLKAEADEQ